MKAVALLLAMLLSACASAPTNTSGSAYAQKTFRVIGNGRTVDEAKIDGFNSAIEFAVGSVVLSDSVARNNILVRDEIAKHSAGYIDDYKIIDQYQTTRGYTVVMDVDVKNSKIAERMLNKSKTEGVVEGTRMSDQFNSYLGNMASSDKFIDSLLRDYTQNAFDIKQGKIEYKLDGQRNSYIIIPYEISWNYKWVTALKEALSVVQDGNSRSANSILVISKKPGAWIGSNERYYFNDTITPVKILTVLNDRTWIQVKIIHHNGSTIYAGCIPGLDTNYWSNGRSGESGTFNSHHGRDSTFDIPVIPNSMLHRNVQYMDKVEMSVVTDRNRTRCDN